MVRNIFFALLTIFCCLPMTAFADNSQPTANPIMRVTGDKMENEEATDYNGNAPMQAKFLAQPQNLGGYTALYEWRFTKEGEQAPFLIRYDENTEYTFNKSGSYSVELIVSFVQGTDTIEYKMDSPFKISISESKLEVPNAFSPNGDNINDIFKVKDSYQSIVSFKGMIFNRWGKKLFEWTDITQGWDGRSNGNDVPDGAYFLHIQAKGADGRNYNIRKTINLLRGYQEGTSGVTP